MDDEERERLRDLLSTRSNFSGSYVTFGLSGQTYAISVRNVRKILDGRTLKRTSGVPGLVCGTVTYGDDVLPVLDISTGDCPDAVGDLSPKLLLVIACIVDGLVESLALLIPWPVALVRIEEETICTAWPLFERTDRRTSLLAFATVRDHRIALVDLVALARKTSLHGPESVGEVN